VRTRYEGGADTGLQCHAIEETASYKLETLAMRYTTVPRYDVKLHDWRAAYCKENDIKFVWANIDQAALDTCNDMFLTTTVGNLVTVENYNGRELIPSAIQNKLKKEIKC
jgi:hypothetical protein